MYRLIALIKNVSLLFPQEALKETEPDTDILFPVVLGMGQREPRKGMEGFQEEGALEPIFVGFREGPAEGPEATLPASS